MLRCEYRNEGALAADNKLREYIQIQSKPTALIEVTWFTIMAIKLVD
jgi:hypothetical protein